VGERKVPRRELSELCTFLGTLVRAGVSIPTALRDFSQETKHPWFRYVVEQVYLAVEAGESLAGSMEKFPRVFSEELRGMVKAGERSGSLPEALGRVRAHLDWQERLSGDIRQATTYPVVVSLLLSVFVLYLFSSVVPGIAKILVDLKVPLPLVTKIVLLISDLVKEIWWLVVVVVVAAITGIAQGRKRSEGFRLAWDGMLLKLPVFGELNSMIAQARFSQNAAVLHRSGLSILENLELCHGLVGNAVFARALSFALRDVREGGSLAQSLRGSGIFSGMAVRMIAAGESSGDLDRSLDHVAAYYEEEVPRKVKRVFAIVEPMLIVTLVAIVGVVAMAIFLPILGMSSGVRQ
jgi:general secretion pathway protein F